MNAGTIRFKRLDVRAMIARGEEPFPRIRAKIDALSPTESLVLFAPFLPSPLIERLRSEGFQSRFERSAQGDWIIYFWRENPPQ